MQAAGGDLADVVSLRIYIAEAAADDQAPISAALKQVFPGDYAPTSTWIIVRALSEPEFLIEIEATALID